MYLKNILSVLLKRHQNKNCLLANDKSFVNNNYQSITIDNDPVPLSESNDTLLDVVSSRLPIIKWLSNYSLVDLQGDFTAGLSVAFTLIPQAIALSAQMGLPPKFGLFSSLSGSFAYSVFGTRKHIGVGPTAILAILTTEYVILGGVDYIVKLTLLSGIIQLILGLFNLSFIVDLISFPVASSFSSAAAISIAMFQLKSLFGMNYTSLSFIGIKSFITNLHQTKIYDAAMLVCAVIFILLVHFNKNRLLNSDNNKSSKQSPLLNNFVFKYFFWIICHSRNATVIFVCTFLSMIFYNWQLFTLSTQARPELPVLELPNFTPIFKLNNTNLMFYELKALSSGALKIAIFGILESVIISRAYSSCFDEILDVKQEMLALGSSNIFGSLIGSFPITGNLARSAIKHNSGVRTPISCVFTGIFVFFSIINFGQYFHYVPRAALSSVIIAALITSRMIRPEDLIIIWKCNKRDLIHYLCTFAFSLWWGFEYGLAIGMCLSILFLLKNNIETSSVDAIY